MTITDADTNVVLVADQTKCKSSVNTKRSLDRTINATDCVISSWILWDCLFFFNIICSVESKQPQQIQHFYCQQEKSTLIWLGGGEKLLRGPKNMREIINFPACFSTSLSPFIFLYFGLWLIAALTGRTFRLQFGGLSGHRYVLM